MYIQMKSYSWFLNFRLSLVPTTSITHIVWSHLSCYRHYINKPTKLSRSLCAGLMDRQNGNAACFRPFVHRPLDSQYSPHRNKPRKKSWPSSLSNSDVRAGWFFVATRGERGMTFAGWSALSLAIERRLRDNHVMWRQARGLPGSCL